MGLTKSWSHSWESICELKKGHNFTVRSEVIKMKGTLLLVSADNLASHFIGGYKALNAALRKCRHCLATDAHTSIKFTAESFKSQTQDAHKKYVEALTGPYPGHIATTYGVVQDSILNSSSYFHVVDGLVPDVLHDLLEGVLQYEVKLLLHHLIYEEHFFTFTLDHLNMHLESFHYGYSMVKNKPGTMSASHLQSTEGNLLGQSGIRCIHVVCGIVKMTPLFYIQSACNMHWPIKGSTQLVLLSSCA